MWAGIASGFSGAIGSLLLAFPLFHLLRAREAIEDLEQNLARLSPGTDQFVLGSTALDDLRGHVRRRRRTSIRVGIAGVVLLVASIILLVVQAAPLWTS